MSAAKRLHALVETVRRRGIPVPAAETYHRETRQGQLITAESASYQSRGDQSQLPGTRTADAALADLVEEGRFGVKPSGASVSRTVSQKQQDGSYKEIAHEEAAWSKEQ